MFEIWLIAGVLALACILVVLRWPVGCLTVALVAWFAWLTTSIGAFAADGTIIYALPWYQMIEPFVLYGFGMLFSTLLAWGLAILQRRTGISVDQHTRDLVQQAAMNAAGRVLAAQEGNVAGLKFDTSSPAIADEARKLQIFLGAEINKLGLTPERVAGLIVGKIGQLQAAATVAPVALPPTSARGL